MVPFRTFRGPLFPKPVTSQELFFAVSYSKPALGSQYKIDWISCELQIRKNLHILLQNGFHPMFILKVFECLVVFVSYIMHFRHTLFRADNQNEMLFTSWKVIKYILKHWSYGVKLFLRQVVFFMHLISHENFYVHIRKLLLLLTSCKIGGE